MRRGHRDRLAGGCALPVILALVVLVLAAREHEGPRHRRCEYEAHQDERRPVVREQVLADVLELDRRRVRPHLLQPRVDHDGAQGQHDDQHEADARVPAAHVLDLCEYELAAHEHYREQYEDGDRADVHRDLEQRHERRVEQQEEPRYAAERAHQGERPVHERAQLEGGYRGAYREDRQGHERGVSHALLPGRLLRSRRPAGRTALPAAAGACI